jgi:YegS/Rv2252/BmrU family lipid kinase
MNFGRQGSEDTNGNFYLRIGKMAILKSMLQSCAGGTMTAYFVIANPTAGNGVGAKAIPRIQEILNHHEADYDLTITERPGHGIELAREASASYDVVVAVGGDGTMNEVVNGLMMAKEEGLGSAILGAVAAGRGNDFVDALDLPENLEEGCAALLQGKTRVIDIGLVSGGIVPDGRYFANCVGVGFDAITTIEVKKLPRLGGFLSFLLAVFRTIVLYNDAPVSTVTYDSESLTQASLMISIMNGSRLGGGFIMAPDSKNNDGIFDLCIAQKVSRRRILTLLPHFIKGDQAAQKEIFTARAKNITITSDEGPLPAQTDGEIISESGRRLEIELLPEQLEAICGPLESA